MECLKCQSSINRSDGKRGTKYCSLKCQQNYQYDRYILNWKAGLVTGSRGTTNISGYIRRYLFEKFDNKCTKCGWCEVNPTSGKIPLEIEHKDGVHDNNIEENLDLLCPNCHSLTSTYRSLNNGNGRKGRK